METEKSSGKCLVVHTCEIQGKFVGLNEYTEACRRNKYVGAKMKKDAQIQCSWFLHRLPQIKRPVKIRFLWQEKDHRRDPDNVAFAQKFILDELVRLKKIPNDTSRWIHALYHDFTFGPEYKVTIYLEEDNAKTV